ncbi:MAG: carbohydrate kinase family protein [Melioribacter sp.]|uniref:carbohydrate kinase family protein n=1 Tax=Rosettibacter primus TaxID=3111523 RepID=UPI00247CA057|nr:carbohydrate kinase family protein [Melioribacter sp.]
MKNENDNIFLLTGINKNALKYFEKLYSKCLPDFLIHLDDMPEVFLKIYEHKERDEFYKNISSSLPVEKINNWLSFDGILINMITGFDITYEQLKNVRHNFNGLIYFDVHTLSRGVDENLKREFRTIPDVENWLSNVDIIQCNESELKTIFNYDDKKIIIENILKYGPRALILTKGNKGAEIFYIDKGEIKNLSVTAEKVEIKNKIGCGDIFGAVFFYTYLNTNDLLISLRTANKIAAKSVSSNNIEELLKEYVNW